MTLLELLVVMCLVATLMGIGVPKLRHTYNVATLRSAKNELAAAVAVARGAAIQKGRPARMVVRSNRVVVTVDTAPNLRMTLVDRDIKATRSVLIAIRPAGDDTLTFDARGFARTKSGGTTVYALTGLSSAKDMSNVDSLCVSFLGLVSKRGCIR